MNVLTFFHRPEYLSRPWQIARRLAYPINLLVSQRTISLPWNCRITVLTNDRAIGQHLLKLGVDDLPLCETLWRLVDEGDFTVDVGANIGLTTSLFGVRAGASGRVHAFEPHPRTFQLLSQNTARWTRSEGFAAVELHAKAVGRDQGFGRLVEPSEWSSNTGGVSVEPDAAPVIADDLTEIVTLDELFGMINAIGVLKIDVEGQQAAVIAGAHDLLKQKRVRDMVFEIDRASPVKSATTDWLERAGFSNFVIRWDRGGPRLEPVSPQSGHTIGQPTNVLSTVAPERAQARLAERGWRCLEAARGGAKAQR